MRRQAPRMCVGSLNGERAVPRAVARHGSVVSEAYGLETDFDERLAIREDEGDRLEYGRVRIDVDDPRRPAGVLVDARIEAEVRARRLRRDEVAELSGVVVAALGEPEVGCLAR